MITRRRARQLALAAACVLAAASAAPQAQAAPGDKVAIGGGAGIVIDGDTYCTLTAIGNDNTGALVGFTSAHCGGPGAQVAAESAPDAGVLGTMVAGNDGLDYAVIRFDPAKVRDLAGRYRVGDRPVGPVGRRPGHDDPLETAEALRTKAGSRREEPGTIVNQVCGRPGDSGAPVTVNNRLVGMIHGAFSDSIPTCIIKYIPLHTPAITMSINAILADLAAKSRPGAGFVPTAGPAPGPA